MEGRFVIRSGRGFFRMRILLRAGVEQFRVQWNRDRSNATIFATRAAAEGEVFAAGGLLARQRGVEIVPFSNGSQIPLDFAAAAAAVAFVAEAPPPPPKISLNGNFGAYRRRTDKRFAPRPAREFYCAAIGRKLQAAVLSRCRRASVKQE